MHLALIILATLLGIAATGSGLAKITKQASVLETLSHVGVKSEHIPLLGGLELAGALGLFMGIWITPLGIAAAIGLLLYFLGAVLAHVRKHDGAGEIGPAFVLFIVAAVTVVLEFNR